MSIHKFLTAEISFQIFLYLIPNSSHLNKTTTFERPQRNYDLSPPEPRKVSLHRSPTMGFGFVAGSEKPVIVRFVTEGGPSVGKVHKIVNMSERDFEQNTRQTSINFHSLSQVTRFW